MIGDWKILKFDSKLTQFKIFLNYLLLSRTLWVRPCRKWNLSSGTRTGKHSVSSLSPCLFEVWCLRSSWPVRPNHVVESTGSTEKKVQQETASSTILPDEASFTLKQKAISIIEAYKSFRIDKRMHSNRKWAIKRRSIVSTRNHAVVFPAPPRKIAIVFPMGLSLLF